MYSPVEHKHVTWRIVEYRDVKVETSTICKKYRENKWLVLISWRDKSTGFNQGIPIFALSRWLECWSGAGTFVNF